MQPARAGPPSQPGRMPLSRQLYQLGQYLMHPIPQSLLPPGYILQVGVVNAPGFMRTAGIVRWCLKTNERQIFHIIPLTLGQLYVIILTCEGLCPPTHFVM